MRLGLVLGSAATAGMDNYRRAEEMRRQRLQEQRREAALAEAGKIRPGQVIGPGPGGTSQAITDVDRELGGIDDLDEINRRLASRVPTVAAPVAVSATGMPEEVQQAPQNVELQAPINQGGRVRFRPGQEAPAYAGRPEPAALPTPAPPPPPIQGNSPIAPNSIAYRQGIPPVTERDLDLAARVIALEAPNRTAMLPVAGVVVNRSIQAGVGLADIVTAGTRRSPQFEPWGRRNAEVMGLSPTDPRYLAARSALEAALSGQDVTGGADHFWSPPAQEAMGRAPPNWDRPDAQVIGGQRFMRLGYRHRGGGQPPGRSPIPSAAPEQATTAVAAAPQGQGPQTQDEPTVVNEWGAPSAPVQSNAEGPAPLPAAHAYRDVTGTIRITDSPRIATEDDANERIAHIYMRSGDTELMQLGSGMLTATYQRRALELQNRSNEIALAAQEYGQAVSRAGQMFIRDPAQGAQMLVQAYAQHVPDGSRATIQQLSNGRLRIQFTDNDTGRSITASPTFNNPMEMFAYAGALANPTTMMSYLQYANQARAVQTQEIVAGAQVAQSNAQTTALTRQNAAGMPEAQVAQVRGQTTATAASANAANTQANATNTLLPGQVAAQAAGIAQTNAQTTGIRQTNAYQGETRALEIGYQRIIDDPHTPPPQRAHAETSLRRLRGQDTSSIQRGGDGSMMLYNPGSNTMQPYVTSNAYTGFIPPGGPPPSIFTDRRAHPAVVSGQIRYGPSAERPGQHRWFVGGRSYDSLAEAEQAARGQPAQGIPAPPPPPGVPVGGLNLQ